MKTTVKKTPPHPWLIPAVFVGSLTPVVALFIQGIRGELGANPISQALNQLGLMALVFLVAALVCTPLKDNLRLDLASPPTQDARPVRLLLRLTAREYLHRT
jgi:DMSO/TMAO reductase YedYZ heme-binding membrane subunit